MENVLEVHDTYEVNIHTMIILPKVTSHGVCSFVKEVDNEFTVLQKPTDIIKHSCDSYGSNYKGRVHGTKYLTGITHKPPIAVNPSDNIFFFPTSSAKNHECTWVSHRHVKKVCKALQNKVEVHFSNYSSDILNVSIHSFQNQLYRTAQLRSTYLKCAASQQESQQISIVYEDEIHKSTQENQAIKYPQFQIFIK